MYADYFFCFRETLSGRVDDCHTQLNADHTIPKTMAPMKTNAAPTMTKFKAR